MALLVSPGSKVSLPVEAVKSSPVVGRGGVHDLVAHRDPPGHRQGAFQFDEDLAGAGGLGDVHAVVPEAQHRQRVKVFDDHGRYVVVRVYHVPVSREEPDGEDGVAVAPVVGLCIDHRCEDGRAVRDADRPLSQEGVLHGVADLFYEHFGRHGGPGMAVVEDPEPERPPLVPVDADALYAQRVEVVVEDGGADRRVPGGHPELRVLRVQGGLVVYVGPLVVVVNRGVAQPVPGNPGDPT